MASCLESPARIRCCKATRMCTQFATTIIAARWSAPARWAGENGSPRQAPRPMDAKMEKIMTAPVAATPDNPRVTTPSTRAMSRRLVGRKITWLSIEGFHEGLVDHHRADDTKVDAFESFLRLRGQGTGELRDLGDRGHLVSLGQFRW